jgi:hypothetical protein
MIGEARASRSLANAPRISPLSETDERVSGRPKRRGGPRSAPPQGGADMNLSGGPRRHAELQDLVQAGCAGSFESSQARGGHQKPVSGGSASVGSVCLKRSPHQLKLHAIAVVKPGNLLACVERRDGHCAKKKGQAGSLPAAGVTSLSRLKAWTRAHTPAPLRQPRPGHPRPGSGPLVQASPHSLGTLRSREHRR